MPVAAEWSLIDWKVSSSSFGPMLVAATAAGLCRLSFEEDEAGLQRRFPSQRLNFVSGAHAALDAAVRAADTHILKGAQSEAVPFDLIGSRFQRAVWAEVCKIPPGQTRSYADIAARLGRPATAARAVGQANAANPIAILIPCHRLVRSCGALAGYAYGLDRKQALLDKERQIRMIEEPDQ